MLARTFRVGGLLPRRNCHSPWFLELFVGSPGTASDASTGMRREG